MNRTDITEIIQDNEEFDSLTPEHLSEIVDNCIATQDQTGSLDSDEVLDIARELA